MKKNNKETVLQAKPFIRWAGGKSQLLNDIENKFPKSMGKSINKYAEPFVGGGAVLFSVLGKYDMNNVYISDINAALINTYKMVRDNVEELIKELALMEHKYKSLSGEGKAEMYYKNRDKFNMLKLENKLGLEAAALFIFLNKTCFNSLYRENKAGLFNVSFGKHISPMICDMDNLRACSKALAGVEIVCADYRKSAGFIDSDTLAFFDPPYRPLPGKASFNKYVSDGFNDEDQKELAKFVQNLSKRGASVILSNSDPNNTDSQDNFFEQIYPSMEIIRVNASRMLNCKAKERSKKVTELLICSPSLVAA